MRSIDSRSVCRSVSRAVLVLPLLVAFGACCGVGAIPTGLNDMGASAVASVNANGDVIFAPLGVGTAASYPIPVHETASGASETLLGASVDGPGQGAFQVVSTFPVDVPANAETTVTVQFTPDAAGAVSAQLRLQTAKMGVSTISLSGTGVVGYP